MSKQTALPTRQFYPHPKPFSSLFVGVCEREMSDMSDDQDERRAELRERLMRYRLLERETTDPVASAFLRDIVSELEGDLDVTDCAER